MIATVKEHYEQHLAPVYVWMAGGFDAAVARGAGELDGLLANAPPGNTAVDLGAGFGMHAIPLARRGYSVLAVDSSRELLGQLSEHANALALRAVEGDLLDFREHMKEQARLVLCMGDTLTHLPDVESVSTLFSRIAESLEPCGQFVTTFRDYTSGSAGDKRFIPVRGDEQRILTCLLEYAEGHVTVHDLLHERDGPGWQLRVSAYRKLRLSPRWVTAALEQKGFAVRNEPGPAGMVRVVATLA